MNKLGNAQAALRPRTRTVVGLSLIAALMGCASPGRAPEVPPAAARAEVHTPAAAVEERAPSAVTQRLRDEAVALAPLAASSLGHRFLKATAALPARQPRAVWQDPAALEYFSPAKAAGLADARRAKLVKISLDETRYYFTKYGSSLAYLRALDLAAAEGFSDASGKSVLDFGYGAITHLRLLASLGARTVGVDPDSYLDALYADASDVGAVPAAAASSGRTGGSVALVHAKWPVDASAIASVAANGPFDLIISKNTLKRGYIKPSRPANKRQLIDLGVSDELFLKSLFDSLKPGGLVVIYNLSPKPSPPDKDYVPWSDGHSPYPRAQLERAGFVVRAHDLDDGVLARQVGLALGWDKNAAGERVNDLDSNLFALYTIFQRPL